MTKEKMVVNVMATLMMILFAGNIYFVKRLVDNQDRTQEMVYDLRQQVAILSATMKR